MPKFTIMVDVDESDEYALVEAWLIRWEGRLASLSGNLGCGCCIDIYDVDGPEEAMAELPPEVL